MKIALAEKILISWIFIYIEGHKHSISPKPTCDKPKAAKRPEIASEASSMRPKVYSSRSEQLPKAPTCIRQKCTLIFGKISLCKQGQNNFIHPWDFMNMKNTPPCSARLAVQGLVEPYRTQSPNAQIICSAKWQSIVNWSFYTPGTS